MDKDKEAKVNVRLLRRRLLRQLSAAKFGYFKGADEDKFRGITERTFCETSLDIVNKVSAHLYILSCSSRDTRQYLRE